MHLEFLVEEPSAEAALGNLLPKILQSEHESVIHAYQGKRDLQAQLPPRLQGYARWLPEDWRIVVLLDRDREDCRQLKQRLEAIAAKAGLVTRTQSKRGTGFKVLNRLAIEELEAWFFGDVAALAQAYPRIPPTLGNQAKYRDPDAIVGGTWESLERVLQRAGYYRGGLPKVEVARMVSRHMDPARNRSKSFQVFVAGLRSMVQ